MGNIFDIRGYFPGSSTSTATITGTKKKRNIFDINEFVSTYKPAPKTTVTPETTPVPKSEPVQTAITKKDYFKETQMQKLDTPAQPAKKWSGMDIKDNIIPQAKDFSPKPVKQDSDKETVKKGIAADWKNIWDGISQRFLGTSSMFFTNPVANSANNQMLGALGGKIAEITTGDKTASYQGASEQAYEDVKAYQKTPQYATEQTNRQAAIDKAAKIVDEWAEKNIATSTASALAGTL